MDPVSTGAGARPDPFDYAVAIGDAGWLKLLNLAAAIRASAILAEEQVQGVRPDVAPADFGALLSVFVDQLEAALTDTRPIGDLLGGRA